MSAPAESAVPAPGSRASYVATGLLVACSLAVSACAGEVLLTVMRPPPDPEREAIEVVRKSAESWGIPFDPRTRDQVLAELRADGVDAYPPYSPCGPARSCRSPIQVSVPDGLLPLGGLSRKTIVQCNEMGQYLVYRADEHGFNNPAGIWGGEVEVAALGDSFTEGLCIAPERNIVGRIRGVWPRSLNLGKGGNGPLLMLATLQEHLTPVRPRIVLWMYYEGNDLQNLEDERQSPLLARYLHGSGGIGMVGSQQARVDSMVLSWLAENRRREVAVPAKPGVRRGDRVAGILKLRSTRRLVRETLAGRRAAAPVAWPYDLAFFSRVLETANDEVRRWGGRMYFVYLPSWERFHGAMPPAHEPLRGQVLRLAKDLGIPVIDAQPPFDTHPSPSTLFAQRELQRAHYSEEGYTLVAEQVIRALSTSVEPTAVTLAR